MRSYLLLLLFLSAVAHNVNASGSFKDVLQRAKEEASHIKSRLRDKERMQEKLKSMQNDLEELYKMAVAEAQRVAEPYLQAGQQSWVQFRARAERASARAETWLRNQYKRALVLHWAAVDSVHGHISSSGLPKRDMVEKKHVATGLLGAYSGVIALVMSLLLRRAF
ncbi:hypothetical protein VOLCADRAFT_106922 [Volvox carteri f. nagariensis]|uniref:Transmembrane protein n=1 Tax=Volvox carteri f. nagariensis TaxID=3068 RepID=D8UAL3_VOLCA|nr:uncharacterized protein VOLCADRAFT_106922 [Volvox carteri f. nagariensis]EFJ43343.1 hypothetical protein VOLCADRAFT_106922 [Volvox carteri f. nagariensis]|eukprot:XP_002955703.1 hypothetical protein VOLCADRAFT_106922 [Volvox carteri f. nagariensis]